MTKVAAVQMETRLGDIDYNLNHARELMNEAVAQRAKVIALPEFFTTSIALDALASVQKCVLPPDNAALDLMREFASNYDVLVGGSYLERRPENGDVYNCYAVVRPDGTVTRHDKDLPTMIENAFYVGGDTDGIHATGLGSVGTAVCWETIRTQTLRRLQGEVDFMMTGSHWWSSPSNWSWLNSWLAKADTVNRAMLRSAPSELSRYLGVANIHASHCGKLVGRFPLLPWAFAQINHETVLLGETQIVRNDGTVAARLKQQDGPGVICVDIELTRKSIMPPVPNKFWIPEMPMMTKLYWWHQNIVGKRLYARSKLPK